MSRSFLFIMFFVLLLSGGCSNEKDIELLEITAEVATTEDTGVEDGKGNKVGSIIYSELIYNFVIRIPDLDPNQRFPYEFRIEPSDQLISVLPKGNIKNPTQLEAYGEHAFSQKSRITSFGGESKPDEPDIIYYHLNYEVGRKGTGVEEVNYRDFPFPNDNEIKTIMEKVWDGDLVVTKNEKEIKRFDLQKYQP